MPSHIRIHSEELTPTPEVDLDGIDLDSVFGLTVELRAGELPRVVVELFPDRLDLDLFGVVDTPLADLLRKVLDDWENDPGRSEAAQVEAAALAEAKGLRGVKGDTAIGFLRSLVNALDAAGA